MYANLPNIDVKSESILRNFPFYYVNGQDQLKHEMYGDLWTFI